MKSEMEKTLNNLSDREFKTLKYLVDREGRKRSKIRKISSNEDRLILTLARSLEGNVK